MSDHGVFLVTNKKHHGLTCDSLWGDGYIEKLVNIRRVVKVVKGGRIFAFLALSMAF
jgi:ribosomal protein S5